MYSQYAYSSSHEISILIACTIIETRRNETRVLFFSLPNKIPEFQVRWDCNNVEKEYKEEMRMGLFFQALFLHLYWISRRQDEGIKNYPYSRNI